MKKNYLLILVILFIGWAKAGAQCQADFGYWTNNLTANFLDSSFSPIGNINYFWDFGTGAFSTQSNPSYTFPQAGSYTVCLTISDTACTDSICKTVTVSGNPPPTPCVASYTHQVSPLSNGRSNVFFTNTSSGFANTARFYVNYGNGNSANFPATNGVLNFQQLYFPGTYVVTLSIIDSIANCFTGFVDTVVVPQAPPCNLSFTHSVGSNNTVNFSSSISGGTAPFSYLWDFGDSSASSSLANPSHTYASSGNYIVTVSATDANGINCFYNDTVTVNNCSADFSFSADSTGTVFFTNLSSSGSSNAFYSWSFGDGSTSTLSNPTHQYQSVGSYAVTLTLLDSLNNCSDQKTDTVIITAINNCQAGFTYSTMRELLFIQNQASNYTSVLYDFGDGTSSTQLNPSHSYMQSGSYVVCQSIVNANGCSDTFCDTVVINIPPPCDAFFTFSVNRDTVQFVNLASNYTSVFYDFGDGTSSNQENPSHIYSQNGSYTVCQTVTDSINGCTDTFCDTILIFVPTPCQAGFSYSFVGDSVLFQHQGVSFNRTIYRFGDGDSSSQLNPYHAYSASGTYFVEQEVFNDTTNCSSVFYDTLQVTVSFSCKAEFLLALDTNQVGTLFLVNTSSNDNTHQYFWDFGDGSTSSIRLPNHQFAKNQAYKICLTVFDTVQNCTSTYCDSVGLDSLGNILKSSGFKLTVVEGAFVGLSETNYANQITAYPNPFNNQLTIERDETRQGLSYELLNSQGKLLKTDQLISQKTIIQLDNLPKGIYYLRLFDRKNSTVKKVIKY